MGLIGFITSRLQRLHERRFVSRLPYAAKGPNVRLHNGSVFSPAQGIHFGRDIYVGPEACFWADGGVIIHDNVIFAPRVTIFTSSHLAMDGDWLPYGEVSETAPVEIHSHTWIGDSTLIMPGVTVGEGAVVAAGSVLTHDVPPLAFVAGNPAVVKGYRDPTRYSELKKQGRFYMARKGRETVTPVYQPRAKPPRAMSETDAAREQRLGLNLDGFDFEGREKP